MHSRLNTSELGLMSQITAIKQLEFVIKVTISKDALIRIEWSKRHNFSNLQLRINNHIRTNPNLKNMKPNKHLCEFFERVIMDHNLNPTHVSLYIVLFQFWNINRYQNPISITRDEVMRISKICSKATYHKCMRELNDKGFLKYEPSFNPYKGSSVHLIDFSKSIPINKRKSSNKKF
jgi:hypothetical protein